MQVSVRNVDITLFLRPNKHSKHHMYRFILFFTLCMACIHSQGQETKERTLHYYIEKAKANSPLVKDYKNQASMQDAELQRLKALYTHSRLEMNGDYLFVPIISKDDGKTTFKWNAQDGTDYYGYDLGESSGHLHAGVTWTKPLLGVHAYKAAQQQAAINENIAKNNIRMEEHQLERAVTEQYLICLLDRIQVDYADSIATLLDKQTSIVKKLVRSGMAKQSDATLLLIEQAANDEARTTSQLSYHTHMMDMNILCGLNNEEEANVALADIMLTTTPGVYGLSQFTEQFKLDSLNAAASLHIFNQQYKPRLDLFANGGVQTSRLSRLGKHLGWSAGLTFSWVLSDGKQKRWKERQTQLQQMSTQTYKTHAEYQREMRISQCLAELAGFDERSRTLESQIKEYDDVLSYYEKEMQAGQVSALDYIVILKNKIQTERDYQLLQTNKQLVTAAYNYWNW